MRKFAYCKVVLATSLVWVMLDMFILLYFSECNKCDEKKERGLPGRDEVVQKPHDGPGEMGKPVVIPKENQEKMKEMFKINQFNLMASEMIALNRSLPDVRLEGRDFRKPLHCCSAVRENAYEIRLAPLG